MERALLFLYAESPVHAGADTALGVVDLPIQREAGTGLPVIWGQSLKGALRDHFTDAWRDHDGLVERVFGSPPPGRDPEPDGADPDTPAEKPDGPANGGRAGGLRPGTLSVGDAQLVAMPAPTLRHTFAWVTCPLALDRVARKARIAGVRTAPDAALSVLPTGCLTTTSGGWRDQVALGPYLVRAATGMDAWSAYLARSVFPPAGTEPDPFGYFRSKMSADLLAVSDDLFPELTAECAEVSARVQLNSGKTVEHGPFHVEYLPTESVLVALLECRDVGHLTELAALDGAVLRLGGNETIGKGMVWCRLLRGTGSPNGARQ